MIAVLVLSVIQTTLLAALIAQRSGRKRAEYALSTSEAAHRACIRESQMLASRLIVSQEAERHRIARDLHDNLSQKLALLRMDIAVLAAGPSVAALAESVTHLAERAGDIAGDVHRLSHDLHPPSLELLGLAPAIKSLCLDMSRSHNLQITFRSEGVSQRVPADVALCLFRVSQEALQNVVKHSDTTEATVRLRTTRTGIRLHIADGGKGFCETSNHGSGLGLRSMRERARLAGGRIVIRSAAGRGTRIVVRLPMPPDASGREESVSTTLHEHRHISISHLPRACALTALLVCALFGSPARALAQTDTWEVGVAPLYFWTATTDGNLAINGTRDIPVYMDFADAKSKLAGAFSFHGEARRGQWGVLGDVNFMRLSTDVSYTTPILSVPIAGTLQLDQILFNGKATYEVKPGTRFLLVGGIRTLTMSPNAHFTGPVGGQLADIDISTTHVAGVAGFSYRPRLGNRVVLLTQGDVGGGSAFTWSAAGGVEFLIKPWIGLAVGYNALHIDTGNVPKSGSAQVNDVQYAVTQYGPAFSLTFHWERKMKMLVSGEIGAYGPSV